MPETGVSREGISEAVEREIAKFQKTKVEEAKARVESQKGGSRVSASQQQDLELLRQAANRVSQQDGPQELLAAVEAATKQDFSQQAKGNLVDLLG